MLINRLLMLIWEKFLLLQEVVALVENSFKQGLCVCVCLEVPCRAKLLAVG